MGVTSTAVCNV